MKVKEHGFVLFIDQASNAAGVALTKDGELLATETICSTHASDCISQRFQDQIPRLADFLSKYVPHGQYITNVVFEGVRSRIVLISVGAFLMCPRLKCRISPTGNFVETGTWKSWARKQGATGKSAKEIKGMKTLKEVRPELFSRYNIKTDDEADATMIWLAWKERP